MNSEIANHLKQTNTEQEVFQTLLKYQVHENHFLQLVAETRLLQLRSLDQMPEKYNAIERILFKFPRYLLSYLKYLFNPERLPNILNQLEKVKKHYENKNYETLELLDILTALLKYLMNGKAKHWALESMEGMFLKHPSLMRTVLHMLYDATMY